MQKRITYSIYWKAEWNPQPIYDHFNWAQHESVKGELIWEKEEEKEWRRSRRSDAIAEITGDEKDAIKHLEVKSSEWKQVMA